MHDTVAVYTAQKRHLSITPDVWRQAIHTQPSCIEQVRTPHHSTHAKLGHKESGRELIVLLMMIITFTRLLRIYGRCRRRGSLHEWTTDTHEPASAKRADSQVTLLISPQNASTWAINHVRRPAEATVTRRCPAFEANGASITLDRWRL